MKKIIITLLFLLEASLLGQSKVYLGHIEEEIDLGLAPYVRRVIDEASDAGAEEIVFRINTFGGRVDAATQIKDAIINSKVPVTIFVDKRAISAGALISMSAENIVMVPGSSIGASTVVDQTGKKVSEKYQSYMRSEMRSTAEKTGRRTDVAEGMVDERVIIEGLVDSTRLVTLTSSEAVQWGIADTILSSLDEVLEWLGHPDAEIIEVKENWGEDIVRFLNNPVISSILIMIAMVGIFTEVKTPGFGLPGAAAVLALALFFGSGYILDLVSIIEILVFVAGIVLLAVEIFLIPGFGIFGILGIILIVASLFLGLVSDFEFLDMEKISWAVIQLAITFIVSGIMMFILAKFLPKFHAWNTLILADNIQSDSGYSVSDTSFAGLLGNEGLSLTDLRPAGTAIFNNKRVDVVTAGEYIGKNSSIKVVMISGSKIVVEEVKKV